MIGTGLEETRDSYGGPMIKGEKGVFERVLLRGSINKETLMPPIPLLSNVVLEFLAWEINQGKKRPNEWRGNKTLIICR